MDLPLSGCLASRGVWLAGCHGFPWVSGLGVSGFLLLSKPLPKRKVRRRLLCLASSPLIITVTEREDFVPAAASSVMTGRVIRWLSSTPVKSIVAFVVTIFPVAPSSYWPSPAVGSHAEDLLLLSTWRERRLSSGLDLRRLTIHFGKDKLFKDVDSMLAAGYGSMPLGYDFRRVLSEKVAG